MQRAQQPWFPLVINLDSVEAYRCSSTRIGNPICRTTTIFRVQLLVDYFGERDFWRRNEITGCDDNFAACASACYSIKQ